jgi:hypothetical protein
MDLTQPIRIRSIQPILRWEMYISGTSGVGKRCGGANTISRMGGRFVSEFGIPSSSSLKTIKYGCVGAEEQVQGWIHPHPQSKIMVQHC